MRLNEEFNIEGESVGGGAHELRGQPIAQIEPQLFSRPSEVLQPKEIRLDRTNLLTDLHRKGSKLQLYRRTPPITAITYITACLIQFKFGIINVILN